MNDSIENEDEVSERDNCDIKSMREQMAHYDHYWHQFRVMKYSFDNWLMKLVSEWLAYWIQGLALWRKLKMNIWWRGWTCIWWMKSWDAHNLLNFKDEEIKDLHWENYSAYIHDSDMKVIITETEGMDDDGDIESDRGRYNRYRRKWDGKAAKRRWASLLR